MSEVSQALSVLLSREELLVVLHILRTQSLPGLDPDPIGEIDTSHRNAMLTAAERALRARGLAQIVDGVLQLHNDLLDNVGACVYADRALLVYHWAQDAIQPARLFGHSRGDLMIVHTRPDPVLHLFSRLPSKELFADQVLLACLGEQDSAEVSQQFTIADSLLQQVREQAEGDEIKVAQAALVEAGVDLDSAKALVQTLTGKPVATIFQSLTTADGVVTQHDFTLLQDTDVIWLLEIDTAQNEITIQVATRTSLKQYLLQLL